MATLIPENLPTRSTKGELDMARLLKRLPEDWIVYHEPNIQGRQPDFVILAPDLGVIVMEIKDWEMGTIHSLDPQWVELRPSRQPEGLLVKNPLCQVRNYWQAVVKKCESDRYGRELVSTEGPWKGHLCFPVGSLVVFTGITAAQVERSLHAAAWQSIFTRKNSILSDQRATWDEFEGEALAAELKPYFRPFDMKERFTAHQIDVLRWVLFPESRMDVILRRDRADHEQIIAGLARVAPTRWLSDKSDPLCHQWVNAKAIKVQTVHSAKGLQYKAVLVLWTDMLPVGSAATDEERRLLYVAITRAENDLVLLGSGAGSFDLKFKETCAVRCFPFAPRLDAVA